MLMYALSRYIFFFLFFPGPAQAADLLFQRIDPVFVQQSRTGGEHYTLLEYRASKPPLLYIKSANPITDCRLNGVPCEAGVEIPLRLPVKVRNQFSFQLSYKELGEAREASVKLFPDDFPAYEVEGKSASSDGLALTPNGQLFLLDANGDIVLYRKYPFGVLDFRPHLVNGKRFYSTMRLDESVTGLGAFGRRMIFDDEFRLLETLPWKLDQHEFHILGKQHYLALAYEADRSLSGNCAVGQYVREYKNGKIVFELSSWELLRRGFLYADLKWVNFDGKPCRDFYHLNSVQPLSGGRWLISWGGNGLMVIHKETKKIEWIFSGPEDQFNLSEELMIGLMHTPHFDEPKQRVLLFANQMRLGQAQSRILEFDLDIKNRRVQKVDFLSPLSFNSPSMGSVERSGKVISVGAGERIEGAADFFEIVDKKVKFKIFFPHLKPKKQSYRVYRVTGTSDK